ncbi:MAG: tRNA 2-selenouridine(34) synthase MnmH, partial [Brevundimonas sp.]|nr:tRNA 2-selenouridine(34) synthase MnmH [Brevundimonas sp.]
ALDTALTRLPPHISKQMVAEWRALAAAGEVEALAAELIVHHYDPAYRRQGQAGARAQVASVEIASLDAAALETAADQVAAAVSALSPS